MTDKLNKTIETSASAVPAPRQLRRWSVAALIAEGVPRPANGGTAH